MRYLILVFFLLISYEVSIAERWSDDFNDGNLYGWKVIFDELKDKSWTSSWKCQDGVLDVKLSWKGQNRPVPGVMDFLQFAAFPISSSKLSVEATILEAAGWFGIALGSPKVVVNHIVTGKPFKPKGKTIISVFHWFTRRFSIMLQLYSDGTFDWLDWGAGDQKWYSRELHGGSMRVVFESG